MQLKGEVLVLVDEHDNQVGTDTRENCHAGKGRRHRAYVVLLFRDGKLLLQQRSKEKLLWPGYWDVSFTSHVYPGESYAQAASRKGAQELNIQIGELRDVFAFVYWAPFGGHSENEYCKLLVGKVTGEVRPNPEEIMAVKYVTPAELERDLVQHPELYTPWLKLAFDGFLKSGSAEQFVH